MRSTIARLMLFWLGAVLVGCAPLAGPLPTVSPSASPVPLPATLTPISTRLPDVLPDPHSPTPTAAQPTFIQPTCAACTQPAATVLAQPSTPTPAFQPATVSVEKLDVWDDPAQENSYWHRQTQLITGERVLILNERGDWAQINAVDQPSSKDDRGYPGWVRRAGLASGWPNAQEYAVVRARTTIAYEKPTKTSARVLRLYLDVRLPIAGEEGTWVQVQLPDGRRAWISEADVSPVAAANSPVPLNNLLQTARELQSAPYLWGGTTPDSPDCSGFIYRLFHVYGIQLARDADDQARLNGQPIELKDLAAGDLIFYTDVQNGPVTHVGLYMGNDQIMDANPIFGLTIHPLEQMLRYSFFNSIRRVLPPPA